ncbi:MAG: hypothetical protein JST86_06545 [Bacteroidetes bacterium]|nr:hypothetical protein [Bacteroidota bacterium]
MNEPGTLIKANPLLPAENYNAMRQEGFKDIEKLGSGIWTEYNNSDPGITMLEAVTYAITDLAYRTGFSVKDLLAPEQLTADTWKNIFYTARQILHNSPLTINDYRKIIIDVPGVRNAWLEPSKDYEVPVWVDYNVVERREDADCDCADKHKETCYGRLGLQPVTKTEADQWKTNRIADINNRLDAITKAMQPIDDAITKLQADITAAGDDEVVILPLKDKLQKTQQQKDKLTAAQTALQTEKDIVTALQYHPSKILEMEGLYNVMVEYEEDVLEEEHREEVRQQVLERLEAHRNLCEDFLSVNAVEYLDFGIGASLVLEEYADTDAVVAAMFFIIYTYFTPSIPFHTIPQMMAKGFQADEIFEGPALHHGFIDTADLEKTDLFRDIRLSDIINAVADIPGVKAITYLHLPFKGFDDNTSGKFYFAQWVEALKEQRKIARIQPAMSAVLCCKENDFITYNTGASTDRRMARMLKMFSDKKKQERKYKLYGHQTDFPVPAGENMELEDYFPVTYSLPLCYGVNPRGLPGDADQKRITQALQLKGYLLFFEQMLSDYLVQLNHLNDLFSFTNEKHTYFTRAISELNDLQSLLIDHANRGSNHFDLILKDFSHTLQYITESPALFVERRNVFLNHLLARFSENLDEYEKIMQWMNNGDAGERLIHDKENILKDGAYYKMSTNRAKAYDYTRQQVWDTPNVSGAEARICRLLGFSTINRHTLAPDCIVTEPVMIIDDKTKTPVQKKNKAGQPLNIIKVYDAANKEKLLLTSVEVVDGCCTEELITAIITHADNRIYYRFHEDLKQRSRKAAGVIGVFWFDLWDDTDPQNAVLLATGGHYEKSEEREAAFKELKKTLQNINDNEGLHLVEHILLRPKMDEILDETGSAINISFPKICLDACDLGIGNDENTDVPPYQRKVHRIPAEKCYDNLPWVLEYFRWNEKTGKYDQSILFQQTYPDDTPPVPLKFRQYKDLAQRVRDLQEFGSERINYVIVSNADEQPQNVKYSLIIYGHAQKVLAQSPFVFNKKTKEQVQQNITIADDIEVEITKLMNWFSFELDLYCDANPCDNDEDPFSFHTTIVLPCWPKRLRDKTFRNLVEKTIRAETPAHVYSRVVWLGIAEMKKFEEVYQAWLQEMAQTEMPSYSITDPLVDKLNNLQPCGCCKDDCGTT